MAAHPISDVNRLLENAIKEKQLEQVRQALKKGADAKSIVTVAEDSCTMLGLAAYYGCVDIMELLIDAGADIEARNMKGETPLFHSIAEGHTEAVKFLLERRANIYATDNDGRTALFEATERNNHEILNVLLAAGADVNVKDNNGRTPRTLCSDVLAKNLLDIYYKLGLIQEKSRIPLQELIEHYNVLIQQNVYPLSSGTDRQIDPLNEFQMLLDEALERMEPQGLLLQSIRKNDLDGVYQALEEGANIHAADKEGRTPLFEATELKNPEILEVLLAAGADVNVKDNKGRTLFNLCTDSKSKSLLDLYYKLGRIQEKSGGSVTDILENILGLLPSQSYRYIIGRSDEITASVNNTLTIIDPQWLLLESIRRKDKNEVSQVLTEDVDVNSAVYHRIPLGTAASSGCVDIVELLIDTGADIEAANNWGRTPLFDAVREGHTETVQLLIGRGAHIHATDNRGRTPLFEAVRKGQTETAQLLIDTGANIEAADNWGRTPLFEAVRKGQTETVQLLIGRDANIYAT